MQQPPIVRRLEHQLHEAGIRTERDAEYPHTLVLPDHHRDTIWWSATTGFTWGANFEHKVDTVAEVVQKILSGDHA